VRCRVRCCISLSCAFHLVGQRRKRGKGTSSGSSFHLDALLIIPALGCTQTCDVVLAGRANRKPLKWLEPFHVERGRHRVQLQVRGSKAKTTDAAVCLEHQALSLATCAPPAPSPLELTVAQPRVLLCPSRDRCALLRGPSRGHSRPQCPFESSDPYHRGVEWGRVNRSLSTRRTVSTMGCIRRSTHCLGSRVSLSSLQ
jgi:hypothetical protein